MAGETRLQPNPKIPGICCEPIGTDVCEDTTDSWCPVTSCDNGCYARLEVSILGSYLPAPTSGAMEALRRVTRYLLGTQNAYVKLRIQNDDPITVELVGYSDSDWAGDPSSRKSQGSGHVEEDGCPLTPFSRRQSCVATSSGMAEYCAMCSTAEELLHLRTILEHFGFSVSDSVAARDIAQRAGLEKVKALAVKTLWLQEVVRETRLQIKSIASKANKADLGTKVLQVARLNALRGACGIVVSGEMSKDAVESENELYPD